MKITYFGDSFINTDIKIVGGQIVYDQHDKNWQELLDQYPYLLADHFNADMESYGYPGSGSWDAFFQFKKYCEQNDGPSDVTVFCWSNLTRLYHYKILIPLLKHDF